MYHEIRNMIFYLLSEKVITPQRAASLLEELYDSWEFEICLN